MLNVALETITIPGTKLTPTRIALGTWAIGGWMWGGSDDLESIRTIQSALDRGITIIDTAPVYGFGHSEPRTLGSGRQPENLYASERRFRFDEVGIATSCQISKPRNSHEPQHPRGFQPSRTLRFTHTFPR